MSEWETVTLSEIATLIKRGRAPHYSDEGTLVVSQKCVREGNLFDPRMARRTDEKLKPIPDWAFLREGDVLVNSTGQGTLGRASLVQNLAEPATADSHVSIVRSDETRVLSTYLGTVLSHSRAELEDLGTGSTKQTELSPTALGSFSIALPPLIEQRRIVEVMSSVDAQIAALDGDVFALVALRSNLLFFMLANIDAPTRSLHEVLAQDIQIVDVVGNDEYPIIGVLNRGRGLLYRESIRGSDTAYAKLNVIQANQVVYSRLKAFEGAITVTPASMQIAYASAEFPTFTCGTDLVPGYFALVTTTPSLWEMLQNLSTGMGGRRERVKPSAFLSIRMKIPTTHQQQTVVNVIGSVDATLKNLRAEVTTLRCVRSELLTDLLAQGTTVNEAIDQFTEAVA
jgi:type I restriction enzyme, S subunit